MQNKISQTKKSAPRVFIHTYGCQMNVADSEMVAAILMSAGYQITSDIEEADIIIFNSCTVRQHAEDRVIGRITQESMRKRSNPSLVIGLIGCAAQRVGESLLSEIKGLDFVVGTSQYRNLPKIIEQTMQTKNKYALLAQNDEENYLHIYPRRNTGTSGFVTIMRGCNNFCSYCIVPYVRGRERSRPYQEILEEIDQAGKQGFKDITLLGQNVNSYHYDCMDFPSLLQHAARIDSIKRLRFVTSHPKDLSPKLIEVMASEEKVCEHLHLPLQSGSNTVLRRMNRHYTAEHYYCLITKLRTAIPDVAITTDVMTGFPGETESEFMATYNLMKEIRFDYAFTFKFSPREGTLAATMENQVRENTKLRRLQALIKLQEEITLEKYKEQIGMEKEIYVEQVSKKNQLELSGRTRDNKIAVFPGNKNLVGKFVRVKITDATGWTLKGKRAM
jgi:tRNA-2-methylthio-N6-dimethylallyladenosine synthase